MWPKEDCLARSKFEYFVSEDQRFSILFISCSWGRSLHRNSSHSNFGYLVSDGQSFFLFPVAGVVLFKAFEVFMVK